jgi:hypothetical protein
MTDPVGVADIAIGVAALFTTCLQVWDFVDAGRAHASNFSLLRTKLDNQRILFVILGKKMGFGSSTAQDGNTTNGGYDTRLDDTFIEPTVRANLNHIQRIFSDTEEMIERYGITIFERKSKTKNRKRSGRSKGKLSNAKQQLSPAIFQTKYRQFLLQLARGQKQTSL